LAARGVNDDSPLAARVKGDARMSDVIDHAINDRERALRADLVVPFRSGYVRLRADETAKIVRRARRRFRRHNSARRWVEGECWAAMAASWRGDEVTPREVRSGVRSLPEVREALERMWPVLTPAELLHDLFGSTGLLRLASEDVLEEREYKALYRPRSETVHDVRWSQADIALLDDAREVLGPKPGKNGKIDESDEIRTYGHIVIDEVQDLTPMQLKMATRRSLNGSMTVVGDLAQATGPTAPDDWTDVLQHLPARKPARVNGLSVGYRIPSQIMELANRVMAAATPSLRAPESVRMGDSVPRVIRADDLVRGVVDEVAHLRGDLASGSVAVVAPDDLCDPISEALQERGLDHGRAASSGLDQSLTVVPVSVVKGLELDAVVVVEPSQIVRGQEHGLRALYVALTRSTQRLSIVHHDDLPQPLADE
jgi:DNA helicase IV